ncbi:MAG: FtsX-like permease family protein [Clostridia bacterium]|nr:FtsX-like permease family protein [Clostridia bacterium]
MIIRLLKKHFINNKTLCIVFAVSQIISLIVALFLFNLINIREKNTYNDFSYRNISVSFKGTSSDCVLELCSLIGDDEVIDNIESVAGGAWYGNTVVEMLFYSSAVSTEVVEAGRALTREEIDFREQVVIANPRVEIDGKRLRVGDKIKIADQECEVVGLSSSINGIQAPVIGGLLDSMKGANIILSRNLGKAKTKDTLNTIAGILDNCTVYKTREVPEKNFEITSEDIMMIFAFIIVNANFVSLYYYILSNDKITYAIFRMCGSTKRRTTFYLLGEMVCICIISFVIAFGIFSLGARLVYNFMNPLIQYSFSAKATARTLATYLLSMILVLLPTLQKYSTESIKCLYGKEN